MYKILCLVYLKDLEQWGKRWYHQWEIDNLRAMGYKIKVIYNPNNQMKLF